LQGSLQTVADGGVETHQGEEQDPNDEIDNIGHDAAPPILTVGLCALPA
jgi:hypothetical protein